MSQRGYDFNMKNKFKYIDFKILIPYLVMNFIGIIMIFSASSYKLVQSGKSSMAFAVKQSLFLVISLILITIIYRTKLSIYQTDIFQKIMIAISFAMLGVTMIMGFAAGGAQRWINLGFISLQPSEFVMITTIIYTSYILAKRQDSIQEDFKSSIKASLIVIGSLILFVFIQPNVGGATILTLIFLVLVASSGIAYLYLVYGFTFTAVFAFIMTQLVMFKDGMLLPGKYHYIYKRFSVMKNPFEDQLTNGFQLINSYYAIYNGGWFGLGLGQSIQKKGFLPVAETDFIFSIVMEELGLIKSLFILALLFFLILRIFAVGIQATSAFNSLVCIGVGSAILIQVFVNLGGILGVIPMTGVPFPFMSYGGSNLLTLSILIGLVLNISANEKKWQEETLSLTAPHNTTSKQLLL